MHRDPPRLIGFSRATSLLTMLLTSTACSTRRPTVSADELAAVSSPIAEVSYCHTICWTAPGEGSYTAIPEATIRPTENCFDDLGIVCYYH